MYRKGVYVLLCANGRYYTGSTDDIERRLNQHSEGKVKSTKNVRPVILKAFIEFETLKEARGYEYKVKQRKSRKMIEELIAKYPVQW